jgi:hypothetical protein
MGVPAGIWHFKPLVDPGGRFASKITTQRFQKGNGHCTTVLYNGHDARDGHSPMEKSAYPGATVMQRPWLLAKAIGFMAGLDLKFQKTAPALAWRS